ncbi:MAG TPA: alkaline phosphatase, partial [Arenimonas sp.]|nr:alkaline phosphatase [Arenimonas sp.]
MQPAEESAARWFRQGALRAHQLGAGREPARNLILFVADGMSLTTVAAARILEGQRRGESGEENSLAFESFPYTGLSKTYNTDSQTPDSAATMTAMSTGAKTRIGVVNIGQGALRGDCAASRGAELASMIQLAASAGLGTGIVTTTRITHATPAAAFGNAADRMWESDAELTPEATATGCRDLARQLVEFPYGEGLDVLMGGGRRKFLPASVADLEYPEFVGERLDRRNLIGEWQQRHPQGRFIWNREQFEALDTGSEGPLLGLFELEHMQFEHDRPKDRAGEPSLAEMTRVAIERLSRHDEGFVLIVEGGRVDHAHHYGNAYRALTDTIAFSDAVRAAVEATAAADDTLILVTADHSHTLNLVGYPTRGNPILGKVVGSVGEDEGVELAVDALGLPFTSLVYANGPG